VQIAAKMYGGRRGTAPDIFDEDATREHSVVCSLPAKMNRQLKLLMVSWCLWQVQEHGMKFLPLQVPRRNSIPRYWHVTKPAVSWCS
jgi:hypothetical protein